MPAPSIFHALERGISTAQASRYDAAYAAVLASQVYVTDLPATEDANATVDSARNFLKERGVNVGCGLAPNPDGTTTLTIFGG